MKRSKLFIGQVETPHGQMVVVSDSESDAQNKIYHAWRDAVYEGFQPDIQSFSSLTEWNGASVVPLALNTIVQL